MTTSTAAQSPVTVAVHPPTAHFSHARLFRALEEAFGIQVVRFDPADPVGHHGVIVFGHEPAIVDAAEAAGVRLYLIEPAAAVDPAPECAAVVRLGRSAAINRYLRGRIIGDGRVGAAPAVAGSGADEVLASVDGRPVWTRRCRGLTDVVSLAPPALTGTESLGDHLTTGSFAALIPLVHYLRDITARAGRGPWDPPPLRASIVLDDPNLASLRYGWLHYPALLAAARNHNFHVSIATVPLDTWLSRSRPRRLLAANPDRLSVSIHGNNHVHHELARPNGMGHYITQMAQARRRMDRLVAGGLGYDAVQVPPHNQCGADVLAALVRLGYEAVAVTRPYRQQAGFDDLVATGGWNPADLSLDGFPILVRRHLREPADDYCLRAFLGAPIVLYGHHEDAVDGCDLLAEAAAAVNELGSVRWLSLSGIMRSNALTRRRGELLEIRPYSRRLHVPIPDGVRRIRVDLPPGHPMKEHSRIVIGAPTGEPTVGELGQTSSEAAVNGSDHVEIDLRHHADVDYRTVPSDRPGPWPVSRRMLVQARDRGRPIYERVRAQHG